MDSMDELLEKLVKGEISLKDIDDMASPNDAQHIKLSYLEKKLGQDLSILGKFTVDPSKLKHKNVENLIGTVEVPLGIAGPLRIRTSGYEGEHFIPIATTEGALVASISRGCKLLSSNNHVFVKSVYHGATRAPLFVTNSIEESAKLAKWIEDNFSIWREIAREQSHHLDVLKYKITTFGNKLWLRINFDTDEAMGMNMGSIATATITEYVIKFNPYARLISLSGNMCADKKPALINSIEGRGYEVDAQASIPAAALMEKLHVTPAELAEVNRLKVWYGGALAGSLGFNSHAANIIAGVFIATGQDVAQVVDSSINYVSFECVDEDLQVTVKIPSLMVGTVGGGTGIAKQAKAIDLMLSNTEKKAYIGKRAQLLAELIAGAVMAGELSLNAALVHQDFVSAHKKLGRGKL